MAAIVSRTLYIPSPLECRLDAAASAPMQLGQFCRVWQCGPTAEQAYGADRSPTLLRFNSGANFICSSHFFFGEVNVRSTLIQFFIGTRKIRSLRSPSTVNERRSD